MGPNAIGDLVNQPAKKLRRNAARRLFAQLGERELGDAIDGHEQIELARLSTLREIDRDLLLNRCRGRVPSRSGPGLMS
jgi:hypothetical protein